MRRIRRIEKPFPTVLPARKRVAAYARVSSGKDAMLKSLSAQISYYSDKIQSNPGWQYIGVYADEAMTGTKENREEFQRLLRDCRSGLVDMIMTKSISRFARNTVTLLETVRELKALGIDVYFEEQNIHTMSGDGELMLTILASFAQEESLSVSENCKWRIRSQFQQGELANLRFMYGYQITRKGVEIDEEQAAVVRGIFSDYVKGSGCGVIARQLRERQVSALRDGLWSAKRVAEILKNEKYAGNALLQKRYVKDHLSKALVKNHGILPQYFAEGTHPAIVDIDTYERAQAIMAASRQRGADQYANRNRYPFSGLIRCPLCSKSYIRHISRGQATWNCATLSVFGKSACFGKRIPEDILMNLAADVLGLPDFDEEIFRDRVAEMVVPGPNRIDFALKDGRVVEKAWQDRSRSNSWTDEMRRDAARRAAERRAIN